MPVPEEEPELWLHPLFSLALPFRPLLMPALLPSLWLALPPKPKMLPLTPPEEPSLFPLDELEFHPLLVEVPPLEPRVEESVWLVDEPWDVEREEPSETEALPPWLALVPCCWLQPELSLVPKLEEWLWLSPTDSEEPTLAP